MKMSKSIKPGRGPSAMGAVGSIAIGLFGIFWTIMAASMGAPIFFVFFGIIFVGIAIVQAIYHYNNATAKNRMSLFDITETNDEPDPLNRYINQTQEQDNNQFNEQLNNASSANYCPYCGNKISDNSYSYCSRCGKEIKQ